DDNPSGLAFDLLSSVNENVIIGHDNGLITIDVAESDIAHREKVRAKLDEPYRTMLGHFRHELGHYFESLLVQGEVLERARELFGDDTKDYQTEIDRHYSEGPPEGWESSYISTYATMHPYEDFAETFAHYLHINETIDNARQFGLMTTAPVTAFTSFRDVVIGLWIPLSIALNQINRGMGKERLYPFAISDAVINKLEFVASLRPSPQT
ncbi:MAG: putative zinc-binding metallopeptidase, partial [Aeromicrobium sp.]